jgi:hypothetical protein
MSQLSRWNALALLRQATTLAITPSSNDNIIPSIPTNNNAPVAQKGANHINNATAQFVIQ